MQQEKLWKLGQTPLSLIVPQDLETPLLMYTVENLRKKHNQTTYYMPK